MYGLLPYCLLAVSSLYAYLATRGCGQNGRFCPDAGCLRLQELLSSRLVGQELAVTQAVDAVCDHLRDPAPSTPLVLSVHGEKEEGESLLCCEREQQLSLPAAGAEPLLQAPRAQERRGSIKCWQRRCTTPPALVAAL